MRSVSVKGIIILIVMLLLLLFLEMAFFFMGPRSMIYSGLDLFIKAVIPMLLFIILLVALIKRNTQIALVGLGLIALLQLVNAILAFRGVLYAGGIFLMYKLLNILYHLGLVALCGCIIMHLMGIMDNIALLGIKLGSPIIFLVCLAMMIIYIIVYREDFIYNSIGFAIYFFIMLITPTILTGTSLILSTPQQQ